MIMNFEETGGLDVLSGRGRKPVVTETVEEVTTVVIERASSTIYFSASSLSVSRELEMITHGTGGSFNHSSNDFSDSFSPNWCSSSSGQHIQISSLFKFQDPLPQINPRYGAFFADPLNDDALAKQLSGCCHSDKTILPVKLDF
ncbi:hypothetical protein TNCV_644751 [Trichonephila clavipes]|nr:hypothetical protein TNCV_644751 [Trichonephila clavipes]